MFLRSRIIGQWHICSKYTQLPQTSHLRCFSSEATSVKTEERGTKKPDKLQVKGSKESDLAKRYPSGITNEPFIKNLFLGRFDKEFLAYPEIEDVDELNELNRMVQQVEKFFTEEVDSKSIDVNAKIPNEVLQKIKDMGLFGQQIPEEYGGLGLNATKYARIAEATALDGSISVTLAGHQSIGLKGLLIAGTEEQKEKYLPKLATGELVAAFCLTEPSSGSDAASIQTRATLSEDGQTYYLNGGKLWISNGGIADVFTVLAKTEITNQVGEKEDKITAFFVERAFGGVTSGKPEDKLGIRGSNTCEVHFDNTPVPIDNVIGEVGGGFKVAMNILNSGRFSMGSSSAGALKRLLGMTVEHATTRTQFGKKISEFGLIQEKIAKMALKIYAMESMAYLTAGVIDSYEKPDLSIEAAMVKIYSSEGTWMCVSECLQILGGQGYMKDYPYERYLRDARILSIFEGTNEILRLLVALSGCQHAGKELKNLVKKLRNPVMNPDVLVKTAYRKIMGKHLAGDRTPFALDEEVHPSLKEEADKIDVSVRMLQSSSDYLLVLHGNKIVDDQMNLKRLADIAIDIYAMTACIGRASRSRCIGLRNNDHEFLLTKTFCEEAHRNVKQLYHQIIEGKVKNLDQSYHHIADKIFKTGGYAAEHPLTRNW
ncbi:complex I assembly factor ACAD9, mitochondrial [Patella vulgata]|uniref:complex I assembly factor ACAD9, mitochondrial n=1 Tax=Patella vulgata TaxID=6465 RepID=UPI0024A9C3C8|nr:complex I assembly factor ACAD9, mitochondrial [Patella vulgata]